MPTLADVAAEAGVSVATVSKVLSNTPYFSEETRQRVMAAVELVGYVPNLAARALSTGKTSILAMVFPRVYDAVFTDPFAQHILEGVEAACIQTGYNLLMSTPYVTDNCDDMRYLQLLESRYMDGIIALDNVPACSVAEIAIQKEIPTITIGYGSNPDYVRSDDNHGAYEMMNHILSLGHRQIGIITVDHNLNWSVTPRMDGMRTAAAEHGIELDSLPAQYGDYSTRSGSVASRQLLEDHPQLTALICLNDRMAVGALQTARAMGRHVPNDLSIVGYDDIPLAQFTDPPLTTVNQQAPELGRRAVAMLLKRIAGEDIKSEIIPTRLIVRESSSTAPSS